MGKLQKYLNFKMLGWKTLHFEVASCNVADFLRVNLVLKNTREKMKTFNS